jgi:hypothetical protein
MCPGLVFSVATADPRSSRSLRYQDQRRRWTSSSSALSQPRSTPVRRASGRVSSRRSGQHTFRKGKAMTLPVPSPRSVLARADSP